MKKLLHLFFILLLILPLAQAQTQADLLDYTGPAKIMVKIDGPATFIDLEFVNGEAILNQKEYDGEVGWLYATKIDRNMVHYVILEPGEIKIQASKDSLIFITGTPNNDAFYELDKEIEPLRMEMKTKGYEVKALRVLGENEKADSVQQVIFNIGDVWWGKQMDFALANSNLAGLNYAYKLQSRLSLSELAQVLDQYAHLSDKTAYKRLNMKYEAESRTGVGLEAPDFTLINNAGDSVSLSQVDSKLILVDFWASWCKPCRKEHPNLRELYAEYSKSGLEIVSISIDNKADKEKWLGAVAADRLTWIQLWDDQGTAKKAYGVNSVPSTFLVGPQGEIVGKNMRGEALNKFVARYLDN